MNLRRIFRKLTGTKACLNCGGTRLSVTAEGGLGQNVACLDCNSLHMNAPFGWKLIRTGGKAKVCLGKDILQEFSTDQEALSYCRGYNREHQQIPGAYVVDVQGVVMTDPLHPIR